MSDDTESKRSVDAETSAESVTEAEKSPASTPTRATVSLPLSTLVAAVVAVLMLGATVVTGGLWLNARSEVDDQKAAATADQRAEQVASDYALGVSTINFSDLPAWQGRLKANATPKLANEFDAAAPKLTEALTVLQWSSSPTPITAKVMGRDGDNYLVDVFLDVTTTNAQKPQGVKSTVRYTVTVNPDGWKVADVGGMDLALPKQ